MKPKMEEMFRPAAMLVGGAGLAQLINFAGTILIAHLYGPTQFGMFAVFIAFQSISVSVATLRLELALVVENSEDAVYDLFGLASYILAASCLILAVWVIVPLPHLGPNELGGEGIAVLPLSVLFAGQYAIATQWCVRLEKFKDIAVASTVVPAAMLTTQVLGFIFSKSYVTLEIGYLIGQVGGLVVLGNALRKDISPARAIASLSKFGVFAMLIRKHHRFVVFQVPNSLASAAYIGVPAIVLGSAVSAAAAGSFSLAFRMIFQPLSLLPAAFGQVTFSKMARSLDRLSEWELPLGRTYVGLGVLFAFPCSVVICFGEEIATAIMGGQWSLAGQMAEVLVLPCVMMALAAGYDRLYDNIGAQKAAFLLSLSSAAMLIVGVVIFAVKLQNIQYFYWFFSAFHLGYSYFWMCTAMILCGFSALAASVRWLSIVVLVSTFALFIAGATTLGLPTYLAILVALLLFALVVLAARKLRLL